jgi:hypothetical protein
VLLSCLAPAGAAPGMYASNMDLLVEAVEETVERALANVYLPADQVDAPLLLTAQTNHNGNWLVEHVLAERLLERGFRVGLDSAKASSDAGRLSYRVLDFRVTGQGRLFRRAIVRKATASVAFRLTRNDMLAWQNEFTASVSDRIPRSRVDLLESRDHSFASTDLRTQSLGQFVEPMIVSTVLGGLTYMFFSNR